MATNGVDAQAKGEADTGAGDAPERTPDHAKLIDQGLNVKIANKLDDIFKTGKLTFADLDERAFEALKEFPTDGALAVLVQFVDSNLDHVSNKSAYLCGMMKTYRQKQKTSTTNSTPSAPKGPDEEKIKAILDRTGYSLDVTTGQRKYGGPPPDWEGTEPGPGCEVFCGKIPKEVFEDELILLFEKSGKIYDLRLMMDPMTGTNRGYAFVTYTTKEEAEQAHKDLDNYEIKPGRKLKVNISVPNLRLFVGNIPKSKGKDEILAEFGKLTAGLSNAIIYSSPDDRRKNRGFCFLEYESHKAASVAKKKLGSRPIRVWNCDIIVDWADPQEEPDSETMAKVKVLYVRNLKSDFNEEKIKELFEPFGAILRIKKLKDYAFVHFEEREHAVNAMNELNGKEVSGVPIEISLAKPPSDKKKKEEMLRAREKRMMAMLQARGQLPPQGIASGRGMRGGNSRGAPPLVGPGDYDYDYDYYGYGDYRGGYNDYYDDFYGYEDYYYDYPPAPLPAARAGGRVRPAQPPVGPGRGVATRGPMGRGPMQGGRTGPPPAGPRGFSGAGTPGGARGLRNTKGNLPSFDGIGKRKFDGGNQNQGDPKRRYQSNWGNQSSGAAGGVNGGAADAQWYQDSYNSTWQ